MEGLGINPELFIAQIINFLILFALLYAFAYKPILRMLDERSAKIRNSLDEVEHYKEQAVEAEQEAMRRLLDADKAGQNILAQAAHTAELTRRKALDDAKPEVEAAIARARQSVEHEREEALKELRQEFSSLTIAAAQKIIEEELDEDKHRKLIERVFEESDLLKK